SALTGLTPSSTYHYRVVASNGAGTTLGADMMFRPFSVTGLTQISEDAYTNTTSQHEITSTASGDGLETTVYFQEVMTTANGLTTASQWVGNGMGTVSVSAPLTGLTPSRTYHYRVVASNSAGTTLGADMMLRPFSATGLTQISEDAYTNTTSQH